jgi:hypothetical protein
MSCSIASFASSTSIFHFILQLSYAGEAKYFIFHSIYFDFCAIEKWVCLSLIGFMVHLLCGLLYRFEFITLHFASIHSTLLKDSDLGALVCVGFGKSLSNCFQFDETVNGFIEINNWAVIIYFQ